MAVINSQPKPFVLFFADRTAALLFDQKCFILRKCYTVTTPKIAVPGEHLIFGSPNLGISIALGFRSLPQSVIKRLFPVPVFRTKRLVILLAT